jgi:hypothetical protein
MRKSILIFLICLCFTEYAAAKEIKIPKPTIFSIPTSYLARFPLGVVTKDKLIDSLGIPDKTTQFEGKTYLAYEVGNKNSWGAREFVYVLADNIVIDVRYNDQGAYNGLSAKETQGKRKQINR